MLHSVDDYTLCELEATYHASRTIGDSQVNRYTDWQTVSEMSHTEWRDCNGRIYSTPDLFSFRGFQIPVQITIEAHGSILISWEENSEWSDFPETHSSYLYPITY
jgi:hypothetical protein